MYKVAIFLTFYYYDELLLWLKLLLLKKHQ